MRLERIDALKFPLIVGIVFVHSASPSFNGLFIRDFISYGVASICLPALFLISGYLFFLSKKSYREKLNSKVVSILIPFLLWSSLPLWFLGTIPSQFWFLQELMFLILISPLFTLLHKKAYLFLSLFLVIWLFFDWHKTWFILSSMLPILFFYTGSVLAVKKKNPFILDRFGMISGVLSLVVFLIDTLTKPSGLLLHNTGILLGLVAVFYLSKFMVNKVMMWLGSGSFFIFCFHQPLISGVLAVAYKFINPTALYFLAPILVIGLGLWVFYTLKRVFPQVTSILVGGRSWR